MSVVQARLPPARAFPQCCLCYGSTPEPLVPTRSTSRAPPPPTLTPNPSLLHCTTHSDSDSPLPYKTPHVEMAQCYSQPGQMVDSLLGAFICPLSSTPALELTGVTHLARSLGESLPHGHHDSSRHHDPHRPYMDPVHPPVTALPPPTPAAPCSAGAHSPTVEPPPLQPLLSPRAAQSSLQPPQLQTQNLTHRSQNRPRNREPSTGSPVYPARRHKNPNLGVST